ncbi:hypothetical protein PV327_011025 [Microctonus hyperodae]|uniref:Uncharacterized protein n=1 Tax=Microctonus hyperodae TaxID=165561 RepID=A0AA39FRF9_MICHY|nr:hypothetical protein PV327_011025 [Microctonus hyperodae]
MSNSGKSYRWKGRIVSKKVYLQRMKQTQLGHELRDLSKKRKLDESVVRENLEEPVHYHNVEESQILEGYRIVNLKFLGQQLWCTSCKETLSFDYVESERRIGLASVLLGRCHKCLIIN